MKSISGIPLLFGLIFLAHGCAKTTHPEATPSADISGANAAQSESLAGKIVFFSGRTNQGDLYVFDSISLKTSEFIITDSAIGASRYNPFNNSIVFAQQEPDGRNIYQKNLNSNKVTFIMPNPAGDEVPSWSPVANKIAYSMEHNLQNYSLITQDLESGNEQVLFEQAMQSYSPVWSPDGLQIAFVLTDSTNNGKLHRHPS